MPEIILNITKCKTRSNLLDFLGVTFEKILEYSQCKCPSILGSYGTNQKGILKLILVEMTLS